MRKQEKKHSPVIILGGLNDFLLQVGPQDLHIFAIILQRVDILCTFSRQAANRGLAEVVLDAEPCKTFPLQARIFFKKKQQRPESG